MADETKSKELALHASDLGREAGRAIAGTLLPGRVSVDRYSKGLVGRTQAVLPPPNAHSDWRLLDLDSKTLDRVPPHTLLQYLADVSPDVSRAVWDALRMLNAGYEIKVKPLGKRDDTKATHPKGQAAIDLFLDELKRLYGSFGVIVNRLNLGAYMRGAYVSELVLGDDLAPIDLVTPDPVSIRFQREQVRLRGEVWVPVQWQSAELVRLDVPTFKYVPIDPMPDSPYGRSPAMPSLFPALFLLGLLHDLRRVVQQQGYPRLDLEVVTEALQKLMPPQIKVDPQKSVDWVQAAVAQVREEYRKLDPDDAFVHVDAVKVNRPVGTLDTNSLGAVDGMIKSLERLLVRALKTMPLLMGLVDGQSADQANRQWEVHASGVKSLQHLNESMLESQLELALEAQGIAADVDVKFAEIRAAEMLRDAQTEEKRIANAQKKRDEGWISDEEASVEITGHEPTGEKLEIVPPEGGATDQGTATEDGEDGATTPPAAESGTTMAPTPTTRGAARFVPIGAGDGPSDVPAEVEVTVDDEQRAIDAWDDALPEYAGLLDAKVAEPGA
jgi:phosphatidylserine decarboxylase